DMLAGVLPYTSRVFARAIVMPNLSPPVTTVLTAVAYRERILAALPAGPNFTPLMTAYLTDATDPGEIARGFEAGAWVAAKLYPANATTNSAHGVTDIRKIDAVLARMAEIGMPLLVHGEVTDPAVDVFDREAVFLERVLAPLMGRLPALRIVLARHDARRGEIRRGGRAEPRRHHHRASPRHQPQRAVPGRAAAAYVLPAGGEARGRPQGIAPRRDLGRRQVLPRHRFRAASGQRQGVRLRLRRHFLGAQRARGLRARVRRRERARQVRGFRFRQRCPFLSHAGQPRDHDPGAPRTGSAARGGNGAAVPRGRKARLADRMSAKIALLPARGVLEIGGPDRADFLQGLITNDVAKIGENSAIYAALLTAQGRFLH